MSTNPYLQGPYAPVQTETTVFDLDVVGEIPSHLDGRYLRIGPNPVTPPGPDYHWFLGDGMVHGVRLREGKAEWYRNRFVRSGDVARALGEPPRTTVVRPHAGMDFSPNTNIVGHGGRTLALVEAGPRPYALTEELETIGPCDFDGTLRGGYTAHPIEDPKTGELHSISYFFGWGNQVRYDVIGVDGLVKRSVDIPVHGSPMIHSFALTQKYVIIFDLPAVFNIDAATGGVPRHLRSLARLSLRTFVGRNPIPEGVAAAMMRSGGGRSASARNSTRDLPYRWDETYPARIGVMPRTGSSADLRWYEIEPCYVFHPLNAYDEGDKIVLDVIRHPKMFATAINGPSEGGSSLTRWTVDLTGGAVHEACLDDQTQEFPRIDDRAVGNPHRYGYSVRFSSPHRSDGLLRHDLKTGDQQVRDFGEAQTVGEFTFVPSSPDAAEDNGVLMGYVHDAKTERSSLVLLDAQTLQNVAKIHLPVPVPAGFHGNWTPTTEHT